MWKPRFVLAGLLAVGLALGFGPFAGAVMLPPETSPEVFNVTLQQDGMFVLNPNGLTVDGIIFESASGIFDGEPANLPWNEFPTDTDGEISDFTFNPSNLLTEPLQLGKVVGPAHLNPADGYALLYDDLSFLWSYDGPTGYEEGGASLTVPSQGPENHPPTIAQIPDYLMLCGGILEFDVAADDPDPGDELTYALVGDVPPEASLDPVTGFFQFLPVLSLGDFLFTVEVTDSGQPPLSASEEFTVEVRIPEPGTLVLLASGALLGLLVWRRRRS